MFAADRFIQYFLLYPRMEPAGCLRLDLVRFCPSCIWHFDCRAFHQGQGKHLYRETTSLIAGLYFLIQLAVGILFILFKPQSWVLPLSIQLVLIVMSIIVLTINILSNAHSSSVEQQRKETQKIFKSAVNALTQATSKSDENDRKYIQTLLIDLKTSPLTASETLSGLGNNILSESLAILQAAEDSDSNGIHAHGSVLSQLLSLRKQNPC